VGGVRSWRSWEGVAWVQIRGGDGPPRYVACVYLAPHQTTDQLAVFFGRLQHDVLAAQAAGGSVCTGGDLNGRTATMPDWDEGEAGHTPQEQGGLLPFAAVPAALAARVSCDCVVNSQGRALLGFCAAAGLVIANGRMAGDQTGEWTFHSMANAGRSVVDYFLLSGEVVGVTGNKLVVQPPADRFDHATLRLQLAGDSLAASAGPGSVEGLGPNPCGVEYRFVPSLLPALVDSLRGAHAALEAAAQAGAAATSLAQLATACEVFDGVVVASLDAVSIPAQPPCANRRPLGWVQWTCRDPLTSRLRYAPTEGCDLGLELDSASLYNTPVTGSATLT
jgi:hypothetical protein